MEPIIISYFISKCVLVTIGAFVPYIAVKIVGAYNSLV